MRKNQRGSVLIVSFWTLIVLSLMAFGVMRRVNAQIFLARHELGKARSHYAATAGLFYVLDQIRKDQLDPETKNADTAFACGVALGEGQSPADIFDSQQVAAGSFSVYPSEELERFGMGDETGKINLNALTERDYDILKILLMDMAVSEQDAEEIAASVIDWRDQNDSVFHEPYGAETAYYQNLSGAYAGKNNSFESPGELLLVRGMTDEIFQKIRPYVTVYPSAQALRINFNTAPQAVLSALAKHMTGAKTKTNLLDAQDFVRKVMDFRNGPDGELGTEDDQPVVLGEIPFTEPERAIAAGLVSLQTSQAEFVSVNIIGTDQETSVKTSLEAVIKSDRLAVVSLKVR